MGDLRNGFHFFRTSNANLGTKEKTESIPVTVPNLLQEILLAVRMRAGFVFVVFQVTCYLGEKKTQIWRKWKETFMLVFPLN